MKLRILLLILLQTAIAAVARAQGEYDRVFLTNGQSVLGRIETGKDKVIVRVAQTTKEFPVSEVKYVQFAGEPRDLIDARNAAVERQYDEVLAQLEKIPPPQRGSPLIRQEIDFYRALALARLAEEGKWNVQEAGQALRSFIESYKDSYHYYDANEAAGDLLVSIGRYDQAPAYYEELVRAPWPQAKLRAGVASGRALQAQGKHAEAIKLFDAAIQSSGKDAGSEALVLSARVGKAKSLLETGRAEQGVALLDEAIAQAPAEDASILAIAYNALGDAYSKLKQPKEALYAYLHVDVLYNQSPEQHAKALYHLMSLWEELKQPQRAKQAADALRSKYPSSRWNE